MVRIRKKRRKKGHLEELPGPITEQIWGTKKRRRWDTEMASSFLPRELGV